MNIKFSHSGIDEYLKFTRGSFSFKYLEKKSFDRHVKPLISSNTKILDVGCGEGLIIKLLKFYGATESNITGVDSDKKLYDLARTNFPKATILLQDILKSEFANNSFDLVTCSMVLDYLDDKNLLLTFKKIHSWLKKSGIFFYVIAHPIRMVYGDFTKYFKRGANQGETPWETMHTFYRRTVADYINTTIKAGFTLELVDEPEVLRKAEKEDLVKYKKYTAYPSRLVVKASKNSF